MDCPEIGRGADTDPQLATTQYTWPSSSWRRHKNKGLVNSFFWGGTVPSFWGHRPPINHYTWSSLSWVATSPSSSSQVSIFGHIWASSSIAFLHCKDFTHKQLDGDTDYVGCVWSGLPTHLGSHWGLNLATMCLLRLESLAARAALINCGETLWGDYCSMPRRPTLLVTSCTKAGVLCCARRQIGHSLQGPAGGRNGAGGSNQ